LHVGFGGNCVCDSHPRKFCMIIAASIAVALLVAWLLFRVFFDDFADFVESIGYWFTPDIISLFRGEWAEDQWASMKLFLYGALCIGSGFATSFGLHKLFG
jgi:hypothetical protein